MLQILFQSQFNKDIDGFHYDEGYASRVSHLSLSSMMGKDHVNKYGIKGACGILLAV